MGFLGSLTKLALDVVVTPIAVIKDIATLGGTLTDQNKSYTQQKLQDLDDDFQEVKDEL